MKNTKGWLKLYRALGDWEWYSDPHAKAIFIHFIIFAQFKTSNFKGQTIERGEIIFGRKKLAETLGLSEQQTRTALNRLKSTSDITIKSTSKFSIAKVTHFELYQGSEAEPTSTSTSTSTSNQPATNQQLTTSKEREKERTKETIKKNKQKKINSPPSLDELKIYVLEINKKYKKNMDAEYFMDKVSSSKEGWAGVKCWKSKARNYCRKGWAELKNQTYNSSELPTTPRALYYFESDGDKMRIKGMFISKKSAWLERSKVDELGYKLEFDKFLIDHEGGFRIGTRDEKAKKILEAALKHYKLNEGASWEDIEKIAINC